MLMNVQQGQIIVTQMQHVQTLLAVLPVLVIQAILVMVHHVQVRIKIFCIRQLMDNVIMPLLAAHMIVLSPT
jgi:hypothetical protein